MKEIIKQYIDLGFECLPCKLDKSPFVKGTWNKHFGIEDFEKATAIGMKCGKDNQNLECLDIDNHFKDAKNNLNLFIEQIKDLYEKYKFPIELTQNGGYHLLYKCEVIDGNQKLAQKPLLDTETNKWRPDTIFETRGEGGYFVCYPTPGYKIIRNNIFNIPVIAKEERAILLSVCKSFNEWSEPKRNEFENKDRPGDVYNNTGEAISEMKSILESKGWKENKKGQWIRPGKKEGISATIGKIAENILYVFSSNAYPFEPDTAYTPFQVKSLLEFNGDFKECAKMLAEKYDLKPVKREQNKTKSIDELKQLLNKSFIDTDIPADKPPVILYISDTSATQTIHKRLFTLSNFSAIIGKAKSRKTYNMSMFAAAMLKDDNLFNKFYSNLPDDKKQVLYFDTEQGSYDAANNIKRIERLSGINKQRLGGFSLREYSPLERCEIIEYALLHFKNVGFVAIDGIADLAKAINDEEEATRVTGLLLRWTKQYNIHISTIIHQNKNDNFATGHLGSSIMKKAEIVISNTKDKGSCYNTVVSCDYSRGIDFEDFEFFINEEGLPELTNKVFSLKEPDRYID